MKLLEINEAIENVINNSFHIDETTGEVFELEDLDKLEVAFNEKIDAIAYYIKNEKAMAEAIKSEADNLEKRAKAHLNRAESLKNYLALALNRAGYDKHETTKNKFMFRKSTSLFIENEDAFKKKYSKFCKKEIIKKIDKKLVKDAIKDGMVFKGACIKENRNLSID